MAFLLLDFDSTLIKTEGLEELAAISLSAHPDREKRLARIADLTKKTMQGDLDFTSALQDRLELSRAHKSHLRTLIDKLATCITPDFLTSFKNENSFWSRHKIFIVSGGFREYIVPLLTRWGIKVERVFANNFLTDINDRLIGVDASNPLAHSYGKVKVAQEIKRGCLSAERLDSLLIIGDGWTDYEVRREGVADKFIVFTANARRPEVVIQADAEAKNVVELIEYIDSYDK